MEAAQAEIYINQQSVLVVSKAYESILWVIQLQPAPKLIF